MRPKIFPFGASRSFYSVTSTVTSSPLFTADNALTSTSACPQMLHGLAKRISLPLLIGVGPKPMAIAFPSGQYATSPLSTTTLASCSRSTLTGVVKYTSSPQVLTLDLMGQAVTIAAAVGVSSVLTRIPTPPAVMVRTALANSLILAIFSYLSSAITYMPVGSELTSASYSNSGSAPKLRTISETFSPAPERCS